MEAVCRRLAAPGPSPGQFRSGHRRRWRRPPPLPPEQAGGGGKGVAMRKGGKTVGVDGCAGAGQEIHHRGLSPSLNAHQPLKEREMNGLESTGHTLSRMPDALRFLEEPHQCDGAC